jgi:uncharacterized caspase-like protein
MVRALLVLAFLLFAPFQATAAKRVALVIGNSAYQNTAVLRNPKNDAEDLSAALKRLGFEVLVEVDLDKRRMERTIRQFGENLTGADVALFFFAGHGIQVTGQNYLLPIDARLSSENDVDFESIPLNLIIKQMEREAKASLVLLDACRDNPLARNLARTMGTRSSSIGQGLAEVKTGVGTLIGYSTQPGNAALDGAGRNSPYAGALLKHVETPGRDISTILINVRSDVVQATSGKQVPWEHTSLMGQVVFSTVAPTPSPSTQPDKEMELAFWHAIKDSKSPELLQTYIDRFPQGTFAGLARVMIDRVEKEKISQQDVARREEELKRAEAARWAAERQKLEAERKAEEAKHATELRRAQEATKKAQDGLNAAEREREQARLSVEAAKEKQRQEAAKLSSQALATQAVPRIPPQPKTAEDEEVIRGIQRELNRVGCDAGTEDGQWTHAVVTALQKYNQFTKAQPPLDGATMATLAAIAIKPNRVCPLECKAGEKEEHGRCIAASPAKPAAVPVPKRQAIEKAPQPKNRAADPKCEEWWRCSAFAGPVNRFRCGERPTGCR